MAKKLISDYTFDASAKTITFNEYASIDLASVLLITNVTDGVIIYNFSSALLNGTVSGNVLTLTYDTSTMSDADTLQIWYEDTTVLPEQDILDALYEVSERIAFLSACRGIASDMRVTLLSGVLTSVGTVTTVSTVTTLANQTNIGGLPATPVVPTQMNITAVLTNINNTVGF